MYKKIVVASDSFKGSLSSLEVADAVFEAIKEVDPQCEVVKVDVADGGEGTMDALRRTLGGEKISVVVADPLGRPVNASYVILEDGTTAVLEMASASGLTLVEPDRRNPMKTSTFGTGQLIADALDRGCRKFLVGIGGSATNDAGMGMMQALGCRFFDADDVELAGRGESMQHVERIDMTGLHGGLLESEFIIACDVDAPLYGPKGAAYVFAPQKGAEPEMVVQLDKGLAHFASVMYAESGVDHSHVPGAGAAGGLGWAFVTFLFSCLQRGIEMVLNAIHFDHLIAGADLVITGEGRVDGQTLTGKTPYGVLQHARKQGIPVVALGGSVTLEPSVASEAGFAGVYSVTPKEMPLEEAMRPDVASENIRSTIRKVLKYE